MYTLVYKFARQLVAKGIFYALIALHPALVIIFHGALIRCMVLIHCLNIASHSTILGNELDISRYPVLLWYNIRTGR